MCMKHECSTQVCKQTRREVHARSQSDKWGNRRWGKYVLKGGGWGWGRLWFGEMYFILLNQFVRFFLEPRYQKSRVFPCKLPSLISLFDALHRNKTHQRPRVRWAKGSKPRWEHSRVPLSTVHYLMHSHVKPKAGKGGTQVERSPQAS